MSYLVQPNDIEYFGRSYTGWLSPEGKFYYCGKFGHNDLASLLAEQLYNVEIYGLQACDYLFKNGWYEIRQNQLEMSIHPYLGNQLLWDDTPYFSWPTPKQLEVLRQIEAIVNLSVYQLKDVDDTEYYLWSLQCYEDDKNKLSKTEVDDDVTTVVDDGLSWYGFWCCTPSATNPLLKEVILIKATSQALASNYANIIFNGHMSRCKDCKSGHPFKYPLESPESYIENNFNHWQFMRTIAIIDLPKQIYWSGEYMDYMSQLNNEGLKWQELIIK